MNPQASPGYDLIRIGPLEVQFLVTGEDSNGSVAMFEVTVPGGEKLMAPTHSHDAYEETVYGLTGVLTFTVNGTHVDIGPGDSLCIPRGAVHRFDNHQAEDTTVLSVLTPAAIGPAFFNQVAAVVNAAAGGPIDVPAMLAVYRSHGLTPAPPPA